MAESKKISLSNFTGSSISIPSGMPGKAKAKAGKGFGTKMTKTIHESRGRKSTPAKKGEKGSLPGVEKAYTGTKTKAVTSPGKGQQYEVASKRLTRKSPKPKKG